MKAQLLRAGAYFQCLASGASHHEGATSLMWYWGWAVMFPVLVA